MSAPSPQTFGYDDSTCYYRVGPGLLQTAVMDAARATHSHFMGLSMTILPRPSLPAAFALLPLPAAEQNNPLAGDTQAPTTAMQVDGVGGLIVPSAVRRALSSDSANADTGWAAFADEKGCYRSIMLNGGEIGMAGPIRSFGFEVGTLETGGAAPRIPDNSIAQFKMSEIHAEIETIFTSFDEIITAPGFQIDGRKTLLLVSPGQRSALPLKILARDAHDADGVRATWAIMPAQTHGWVGHDHGALMCANTAKGPGGFSRAYDCLAASRMAYIE